MHHFFVLDRNPDQKELSPMECYLLILNFSKKRILPKFPKARVQIYTINSVEFSLALLLA